MTIVNQNDKIALIVEGSESYGVRRFITQIARSLHEQNSLAGAISLEDGQLTADLCALGIRVECLHLTRAPNFRHGLTGAISSACSLAAYTARAIPLVRKSLRTLEAKSAVTRMPNLLPIVGSASRAESITSFWLMPNSINDGYPLSANKHLYSIFFRFTKLIPIANSYYTATTLPKRRELYEVMHLGILPADFPPTGKTKRHLISASPRAAIFGIFARLRPEKGQLQFLRAFADFAKKDRDLNLLIVGGPLSGDYYNSMLSEVKSLGLEDNVHMIGERSDLAEYYRACDVIVNCRLDAEPFGLSVIEGLLSGKPVLAHRLGGPGETIVDGETGWLMGGAPEQFSEGIRRALSDRERWASMGAQATAHAQRNFSVAAASERLLNIIRKYRSELP